MLEAPEQQWVSFYCYTVYLSNFCLNITNDCRLPVSWGNQQHKLHSRIITNIKTKNNTDPVEKAITLLQKWLIGFRVPALFFYFVPSFRIIPGCFFENIREYVNVYIHCICVYLILYRIDLTMYSRVTLIKHYAKHQIVKL